MKGLFSFISLFLLLLLPKPGQSQQNIWKNIGSGQEFPSPTVTCFKRLPDGRMAMGTPEGLVLFDGNGYRKIVADPIRSELINPYVNDLRLSRNGILWIATRNSLWSYQIYSGALHVFYDSTLSLGGIKQLELSENGNNLYALFNRGIWVFGAQDTGKLIPISKIDAEPNPFKFHYRTGRGPEFYFHQLGFKMIEQGAKKAELTDRSIIDAQYDSYYNFWLVLKKDGVYSFSKQKFVKLPLEVDPKTLDFSNHIFGDENGGIWISTSQALLEFKHLRQAIPLLHTSDKIDPYSLLYHSATCALVEKNGNTWIGGSAGSFSYSKRVQNGPLKISYRSLGVGFVWTFFRDGNTLLLGSSDGVVLGRMEQGRFEKTDLIVPHKGERFVVSGICNYNAEYYLIGTFNKGFWKLHKKTHQLIPYTLPIEIGNCQGIQPGADQSLLIQGTYRLAIFQTKESKFYPFGMGSNISNPIAAYQDHSGKYYIGSGHGISVFDKQRRTINTYVHQNGDSNSLSGNIVLCMKDGPKETMYVGTMGGGLCVLNKRSNQFKQLSLPGNPVNIYGILSADSTSLLLSSSNGLILYRLNENIGSALNQKNVLPFNDFGQLSLFADDQYYYAGGENAVILLPKKDIRKLFSSAVQAAFRRDGLILENLKQTPDNRSISLQLGLSEAQYQGEITYRYRLKGLENDWHYLPKNQHDLAYNYLPAGTYTLEAQLLDDNNYFIASPAYLSIQLLPYYYEQIWFQMLAALVVVFMLVFLIRYFTNLRLKWKLKKLEEAHKIARERIRISRELHDNVGSQLSYLISGLEASELYLQKNNGDKLAQNIVELQESARESMQQLRDAIWALNRDEMSVNNLGEQFSKWFNRIVTPHPHLKTSVVYRFEHQTPIDPVKGLNLFRIMQEAVNNALKHAEAQEIKVSIQESDYVLKVEISDNGKGFLGDQFEGHGLNTMSSRARENGISFTLQSSPGKGCCIELELKINTPNG